MTTGRRWYAAALLCTLAAAPGAAQETPGHGPEPPVPFILSISGGISLGAYQAGVNWGLLELVRSVDRDPGFARGLSAGPFQLAAAAGASAGNINTLLWAIESCTKREPVPPEESLFHQFWVQVGLSDLLRKKYERGDDRSILDRQYIEDNVYPLLQIRMRSQHVDPTCNVPVGITLTRIRPDTLSIDSLDIETQRFATIFTVRANPSPIGEPWLHFSRPHREQEITKNLRLGKLILLPGTAEGQIRETAVFAAVEASSAFPLAFQPRYLHGYHPDEGRSRSDWYMDGGVFDNNPVNLAVELYGGSYPRTPERDSARRRAGQRMRDVAELVFVNPGRLRGHLREQRGSASVEPVVPGGMKSVVQLLRGAVPTARQYELQLWARGQGMPDQDYLPPNERDSVAVRLTSRGHPIVGEHLNAFASFLGRPFREYDFYVGVYDALHFAVETYACNRASEDPDCVPRRLRFLIAESELPFGDVSRPVLDWLFRREYGGYRGAADKPVRWPSAPRDSLRVRVLLALARANDLQYRIPNGEVCPEDHVPGQVLCRDGFLKLLRDWKADSVPVRAIVRGWVDECREARRDDMCEAERDLLELIDDPVGFTANTIDLVLDRMQQVERALKHDSTARTPGVARRVRPAPTPSERVTEALTAFYRSRPLRPRNGLEWNPSSVPGSPFTLRHGAAAWIVGNVFPYRITSNLGDTGGEVGWVGAGHLGEHLSVTLPITVGSARKYGEVPVDDGNYQPYAGAGVGLALRGVLTPTLSMVIPEAGVTAQRFWMVGDRPHTGDTYMGEAYADFAALAGRLRLGIRWSPDADVLHNGHWAFSAGVADVNGFVYWMGKLLK